MSKKTQEIVNSIVNVYFKEKAIPVQTNKFGLINKGPKSAIGRTPKAFAGVFGGKVEVIDEISD